ncbi:MAG: site-specific DNA-methyltransferase [Flexibacter sp. CG_4_10_14_3_um_filter_32_15]|nr:MAG: site-specific DNA-methyltransferase [Flexibacter sp. CG_4_10_14_3_um_filter_32_15]
MAENKLNYNIYEESCYSLKYQERNSIDALITDPPYGIAYQNHHWDKGEKGKVPDEKIWKDSFDKLKPGGYGLVFSFPRVMHHVMKHLEESGFIIKDVLMWCYLNGMPKTRNVGLDIDKELGVESEEYGQYNYVIGYVKEGAETYKVNGKKKKKPASDLGKIYDGAGYNLKPAYEPIILVQKPIEEGLTVAQNIKKYRTGAMNLEKTRLPYSPDEDKDKVGHNPHPLGRVPANVIRSEELEDDYDKYFLISTYGNFHDQHYIEPKVRRKKDTFNMHPTVKPIKLMQHLIRLLTFENQTVLDPFMGSGSTGVACMLENRNFEGYELEQEYFKIAEQRIKNAQQKIF